MGVGKELRRQSGAPFIAGGTDIAGGNLVKLVGNWQVRSVATFTDVPIGIARASAPAGQAVDIRDIATGDIVRAVAGATIVSGEPVGWASNATAAGASGVIQISKIGPVSKGASLSGATWSVGEAVEGSNPGNTFAFRVNPRQLSGLS